MTNLTEEKATELIRAEIGEMLGKLSAIHKANGASAVGDYIWNYALTYAPKPERGPTNREIAMDGVAEWNSRNDINEVKPSGGMADIIERALNDKDAAYERGRDSK